MPRATLPPTPASSTDIKGKDGSRKLSSLQMSFELPPPAIAAQDAARLSPANSQPSPTEQSPSPSYPVQPSEAVKARRRSSAAAAAAAAAKTAQTVQDAFTLPPPPTRSRKIIQMKPRTQDQLAASPASSRPASKAASSSTAIAAASRKKQPSANSVAGRKIARKTAHSLIERRRRSKMNEEFAVLKNMIPACTGEMHKLAILQASIEYVRYLEDCISKLKAQGACHHSAEPGLQTPSGHDYQEQDPQHPATFHSDPSGDVEMSAPALPSPAFPASHVTAHQTPISPELLAEDSRNRQASYSSASTDQRHYSYSASTAMSPAFGPQSHQGFAGGSLSAAASALTSPALGPTRDLDQEATAALLMLNSDRRRPSSSLQPISAGRGMSVRDLLSG